jgi:hypothetical protein
MSIYDNPAAKLWREQFKDAADNVLAGKMLKKFKFVSASEFRTDMHTHILHAIPVKAKAAFFIERELQLVRPLWQYKKSDGHKVKHKFKGKVAVAMYQEIVTSRGRGLPKRWTASGSPVPPVKSPTNLTQDIGSEGLVATLVSKICKTDPSRFAMHPHTKALHEMNVKYLVVVTDFIGSGSRTKHMLDSLWRVATVRSWKSGGYIEIMVICYSATDLGYEQVKQHPCQPEIKKVRDCPTISASFSPKDRFALTELCNRIPAGVNNPLGYKDTGALIAFEHSCPNNVPAMFTDTVRSKAAVWNALFPRRITDELSKLELVSATHNVYTEALDFLKCGRIAKNAAFHSSSVEQQAMVVLLAAVYRGRRHTHEIVTACGFPMVEVLEAWGRAEAQGLLTKTGRLSISGFTLLENLMVPSPAQPAVAIPENIDYYPSSLREPIVAS